MRKMALALGFFLSSLYVASHANAAECQQTIQEALQGLPEEALKDMPSEAIDGLIVEDHGQKTLSCKGREYLLPLGISGHRYRYGDPETSPNECYMAFLNFGCDEGYFGVSSSSSPVCRGAHVCGGPSFSFSTVKNQMAINQLMQILPMYSQTFQVSENVRGYEIPGACYAYCNPNQIVWLKDGRLYNLSEGGQQQAIEYMKANAEFERLHQP